MMAVRPSGPSPVSTALARLRSAASPLRVSMKRRYQLPSRSAERAAGSGSSANLGAWPRVSRDTKASPCDQGEHPILLVQPLEHVGHAGQHGEPRPPPRGPVARSEVDPGPDDRRGGLGRSQGVDQAEDGLGHHERQPLLQAFVEPAQQLRYAVDGGLDRDDDVVAFDAHRVGADIVGEGIEGAARLEVEAGVVPVAGQQTVFDRAPVQGEAQVRAAVVDRVGPAVAPEDAHRLRPELAGQLAFGDQGVGAADPDAFVHGRLPLERVSNAQATTRLGVVGSGGGGLGRAARWDRGAGGGVAQYRGGPPWAAHRCSRALSKVLFEHPPEQLAGLVVGQRVPDLDDGGHARRPQVLAHPRLQFLLADGGPGLEHDGGRHHLAPFVVRYAHDRGVGHTRMLQQDVLDLAGRHVLPTPDDHVVEAALDEQKAGRRPDAAVIGGEPAVGVKGAASLILPGDLIATHVDLAGLTRVASTSPSGPRISSSRVGSGRPTEPNRAALRGRRWRRPAVVLRPEHGDGGAGLGQAVGVDVADLRQELMARSMMGTGMRPPP